MKRKKYFVFAFVAVIATGFGCLAHAQMVGVTLPSVPSGVIATAVPPSQVSISWSASTESSGTVEGYYVYRNGGQITTTAGTAIVDSGLVPGVYIYTISAYDANGNTSAKSSQVNVALVNDTIPPASPTGVTVTGATSTNSSYTHVTLTISWNAATDNVGVAGYKIYRDGTSIVSSTSAFTGTSITDTVFPGTYSYTVVAYDASQNFSNKSVPVTITIGVDTTAPSVPKSVSAQQVSAAGVNLSWATSTDNIGVLGYQVYRNGVWVASTTAPSYSDTGLSVNVAYIYTVTAYDAADNISNPSEPADVTLETVSGPIAPYSLSSTLLGTSTIKLYWSSSVSVLAITGYTVYRNDVQIAFATSTNYLDIGLTSGTYRYSVSATDVSGAVSATSSALSVLVPVVQPVSAPIPTVTSPVSPSSNPAYHSVASPEISPITTTGSNPVFTKLLYFGLRNTDVDSLQSILVQYGYLTPVSATGFFGNLTLGALQKFQCDQKIICTGGAGWGIVGPKTRNVLNSLQWNTVSSTTSIEALTSEIQSLQAELANLEKQFQSASK